MQNILIKTFLITLLTQPKHLLKTSPHVFLGLPLLKVMPKVKKERQAAAQRKGASSTQQAVRQSITFNKDFGQHILRVITLLFNVEKSHHLQSSVYYVPTPVFIVTFSMSQILNPLVPSRVFS